MKKKIAVLTSSWSDEFVVSVINGMKRACEGKNIDIYVFTCYKYVEPNGEPNVTGFAIYDLVDYSQFDGVVITPNLFNDDERAEYEHQRILKAGIPAVSINQQMEGLHFVNSSNHRAYKKLINHIVEKHGAKELAYIGGPIGNAGADSNFNAFKEVLKKHKLEVKEENLCLNGNWTYGFGYEQAKNLLNKPGKKLDAIICVNDGTAMGATKAAIEMGYHIPEDILVIGFDDISFASTIIPSISTINVNADLMGETAINLILENPSEPVTKEIKASIEYRQSCGCIHDITYKQIKFSQNYSFGLDGAQRFASQLRHMEDVFLQTETVEEVKKQLLGYFEHRHAFEGNNFAILIKEEVIKSLSEVDFDYATSTTYGSYMNVLVDIKAGKGLEEEDIPTLNIIPDSMRENESTLYVLFPIFNQKYLHGYYVAKNFLGLVEGKYAYNWTRNFGTSIEKFRQTVKYRLMSEQLRLLSTRDALSGLLNRMGLDIYAIEQFENSNRTNKKTIITFVDINQMKIINDRYGHLHGDLAVKTVAESIRDSIPKDFLPIRYGGDEFVIIGSRSRIGNIDYCKRIDETLKERIKEMSLPYELTVSSGEKVFEPGEKESLLQAIEEVDKIMYTKKKLFHKANK